MAVAYSGTHQSVKGGGSQTNIPLGSMAISGANPVVVIGVALFDLTVTVSSITVGAGLTAGTPTLVKDVRNGTCYVAVWVVPAPSGTGVFTVNLTAAAVVQVDGDLFTGADQTTPCPTGDAATNTGTNVATLTASCTNLTANDATFAIGGLTIAGNVVSPFMQPNALDQDNTTAVNFETGYRIGTGDCTANYTPAVGQLVSFVGVRIAQTASVISGTTWELPQTQASGVRVPRPIASGFSGGGV